MCFHSAHPSPLPAREAVPLTYGYWLREQPSTLEVNLSLDTGEVVSGVGLPASGILTLLLGTLLFHESHRKLRGDLRVGSLQGFKEGYAAEPRVSLRSNSLFPLSDVRFSHFNSR